MGYAKTLILYFLQMLTISSILSLTEANLINETCKKTPFYGLCVSIIHADPASSQAKDTSELGVIVVRHVESKSKETLTRITQLLRQTKDPKKKKALESCSENYAAILKGAIKPSIDAFMSGNFKFAREFMSDAAAEASECEGYFRGCKSPIVAENNEVNKSATIAAAIAISI